MNPSPALVGITIIALLSGCSKPVAPNNGAISLDQHLKNQKTTVRFIDQFGQNVSEPLFLCVSSDDVSPKDHIDWLVQHDYLTKYSIPISSEPPSPGSVQLILAGKVSYATFSVNVLPFSSYESVCYTAASAKISVTEGAVELSGEVVR